MMELDPRKQSVLRAIVTEYVRTAEPVGSERLADSNLFAAKAATIRNEMAALSALGYLVQPHTSAGRIPSDKGYRFFVDRLMPPASPAARVPRSRFHAELDEVLRQTCRILSGITHCAAVATPPQREAVTVQAVHLTPVKAARIVVVVILSSGEVEHRFVDLGQSLPASTLTRLNEVFNAQMAGLTLAAAKAAKPLLPPDIETLAPLAAKIHDAVVETVARDPDQAAVLEGTTQVLREPEFQDEERRESLLRALENRRDVLETIRAQRDGVEVTIGSENPRPAMRDFSFVATRYHVGLNMSGVIGVFGPTRMPYSDAVPAVRNVAHLLGEVLTRLSVE